MATRQDVQHIIKFLSAQLGDGGDLRNDPLPHLWRLVAEGEPVALDRLAAAAGRTVDEVRRYFATAPDTEWDDSGRIVGFGLTLRPTPHSFTVDGATVYGWCATDVLIAPVLLRRSGVVESTCPFTGQPIHVEVTPEGVVRVDPPQAVVSVVRPSEKVADLRAETCALGHFFSSREVGAPWLEEYPHGQLRSLYEEFEIDRQVFDQLGWTQKTTSVQR
jgi:alkylmercury lyase